MNIKWFGHSTYLITTGEGIKVLIDPLGKLLGYKMPRLSADIVAVTHNHRDHNQVQIVNGEYSLVNEAGLHEAHGIRIKGIKTFHDNVGGAKRGNNLVFVFELDGLKVAHCGDLGHVLSDEQVKDIGHVDVLMIPVGGRMTLDGQGAYKVVHQLKPSLVIPMHYRTRALGLPGKFLFEKADEFLKLIGPVRHEHELVLEAAALPDRLTAVTLEYK